MPTRQKIAEPLVAQFDAVQESIDERLRELAAEAERPLLTRLATRNAALQYARELGWIALPASAKIPHVHWNWHDLPGMPALDVLEQWWRERHGRQIALVTGTRSGIVVADVDGRHGGTLEALWEVGWPRETVMARSGSGQGWHSYVQCPPEGLAGAPKFRPGIEIKADGNIVIAPPSPYGNGGTRRYEWLPEHSPYEMALATLSEDVVALVRAAGPRVAARSHSPHRSPAGAGVDGDAGVDRDDPNALAYSVEDTRQIATALYWKFIRRARQGEGRNNMVYRLSRQLDSLGMTRGEITAWARRFAEEVDHD